MIRHRSTFRPTARGRVLLDLVRILAVLATWTLLSYTLLGLVAFVTWTLSPLFNR